MTAYDPKFRVDTLCADVRKQRRILKRLREEKLTLPANAPPRLKAILDERIDTVALALAKNFSEAREAALSLSSSHQLPREIVERGQPDLS